MIILLLAIIGFLHGVKDLIYENFELSIFSKKKSKFYDPKWGITFMGFKVHFGQVLHVAMALSLFLLSAIAAISCSDPESKRTAAINAPFIHNLIVTMVIYVTVYNVGRQVTKKGHPSEE